MDGLPVPLDIIEHIIDWVDVEARADYPWIRYGESPSLTSLKACSLAARQFLPFARRKIFSKISFLNLPYGNEHRSRYARSFNRLLDRTPDIVSFVRSLDYGMRRSDFADVEVRTLLGRLSMIKELDIYGTSISSRGLTWDAIPLDFLSILNSIFHLPSLRILRVTKFLNFPISLLADIPHLRILDICRVQFNEREDYQASTTNRYARSRLLELHTTSSDIQALLPGIRNSPPAFDITDLKSLYVTVGFELRDAKQAIDTIFEATCASVMHLSLTLHWSFPEIISINALRKLQTLHVSSEYHFADAGDSLHCLANYLASGNTPFPGLKSIAIDVYLDSVDGVSDTCFDSWPVLDRLLVTEQFPELRNVSLAVNISYSTMEHDSWPVVANFQDLRLLYFPLLSATKSKAKFHFAVKYC